jgi:hypothetical protein
MEWVLVLALFQQAAPANPPAAPPAETRATDAPATRTPAANVSPAANEAATPVPAAPADVPSDAWVQEARDWLVSVRMAYENMTPRQTQALQKSFEKLPPAALRVLVTVYEHTYGVQSPLSAADRRPPNATEAEREWIMAYRILYDRLSVNDAQAYAQTLRAMNPRQIRTLIEVYEEKNRQQIERQSQQTAGTSSGEQQPDATSPPTAEEEAAAQRAAQIAQQRMEFNEMSRQLALGRASTARSDTKQAMLASNAAANASADAAEQRVQRLEAFSDTKALQQSAFQNEMYTRGHFPNSSPGGTFFYGGF